MLVQLANRLQVVFNSLYGIPLIICDTGARVLYAVVEYCIVLFPSHDIVQGFNWLRICSPYTNQLACTLLAKVTSGYCLLAGLPCNYTMYIEIASLDSIYKGIDHDAVACFIFIHLIEPLDTMGACGTLAVGESGDAQTHHWDDLYTEFADILNLRLTP